jgi:hypothetical protein
LIAEICKIVVQILRKSQDTALRCAAINRILINVQYVSLYDNEWFNPTKDPQFAVPFRDIVHDRVPPLYASEKEIS